MNILVDTSVWSQALRRDIPAQSREVVRLKDALQGGEAVFTTGLILQELLQGFSGPRARSRIIETFAALPLITPDRKDHIEAAALRNSLHRKGVQAGTIDALLAQLCLRHGLRMLSVDADFSHMACHVPLLLI